MRTFFATRAPLVSTSRWSRPSAEPAERRLQQPRARHGARERLRSGGSAIPCRSPARRFPTRPRSLPRRAASSPSRDRSEGDDDHQGRRRDRAAGRLRGGGLQHGGAGLRAVPLWGLVAPLRTCASEPPVEPPRIPLPGRGVAAGTTTEEAPPGRTSASSGGRSRRLLPGAGRRDLYATFVFGSPCPGIADEMTPRSR